MSQYITNMPKESAWSIDGTDIVIKISTPTKTVTIQRTDGEVVIGAQKMHELISVLEDAIKIIDEDIKQREEQTND